MPPYDFHFFFSSGAPLENEIIVVSFAVAELKGDINSGADLLLAEAGGAFSACFSGCWNQLSIKGDFDFLWLCEPFLPFLCGEYLWEASELG